MKKIVLPLFLSALIVPVSCGQGDSYSSEPPTYSISWLDEDGSVLLLQDNVSEGSVPHYPKEDPVKEDEDGYSYVFSGWTPEFKEVVSNQTYTATYDKVKCVYTLSFDLNGGESPSYKESKLATGLDPSLFFFDVSKEGYEFKGWSADGELIIDGEGTLLEEDFVLSSDLTFTAAFAPIAAPSFDLDCKRVTYGYYPQTHVKDEGVLSKLNSLGPSSAEGNLGWYLYEGNYYAKLTATPFEEDYEFNDGEKITSGKSYWFACEPVSWRVLSEDENKVYILSESVLDLHIFNPSGIYDENEEGAIKPNVYETSILRSWLNSDFASSLFLSSPCLSLPVSISEGSKIALSQTKEGDSLFLPNAKDFENASFGFGNHEDAMAKGSDYARAKGSLFFSNQGEEMRPYTSYLTSSVGMDYKDEHNEEHSVLAIEPSGWNNHAYHCYGDSDPIKDTGIRPAMYLPKPAK